MASQDEWKELVALLEAVSKAIHEAFERGEEPSKDGQIRSLLDRANEIRKRLGI